MFHWRCRAERGQGMREFMLFWGRLRGFRRRDDLQAQVAHGAKVAGLGPPQRSCPAFAFQAELLAVALENVLDKGLAAKHHPVG